MDLSVVVMVVVMVVVVVVVGGTYQPPPFLTPTETENGLPGTLPIGSPHTQDIRLAGLFVSDLSFPVAPYGATGLVCHTYRIPHVCAQEKMS